MAFQILDANKQPVSIDELDKQAAEFWNKEFHPRHYAEPKNSMNWFDAIGWMISNPRTSNSTGWNNVRKSLWVLHVEDLPEIGHSLQIQFMSAYLYLLPYFSLITYWESMGYEPKNVDYANKHTK